MAFKLVPSRCLVRLALLVCLHWLPSELLGSPESLVSDQRNDSGQTAFNPQGLIIDSIEIVNRNIYNTQDEEYDGFLFRTANRLHMVTRRGIIRRELLFKVGQPFSQKAADETARNLRTRFPLNDAWIEAVPGGDGGLLVRVVTADQWSLIGGIRSIHRDGNETDIRFGFEERNFLGRAQFVSFDYFVREADDNFITSAFREPRIFGRPISLHLNFSNNPEAQLRRVSVGHPFFYQDQRFAFTLAFSDGGGRVDRFDAGSRIAKWDNRRDLVRLTTIYRWGSYYAKSLLAAHYTYLSQRTDQETIFDSSLFVPSDFPVDSTYHQFSLQTGYNVHRFIVVRRINGFEYNEDFALGAALAATFGRSFKPDFKDHHFDFIDAALSVSRDIGQNMISVGYRRTFWFKNRRDIRRLSRFSLLMYNYELPFLTLALKTSYISDKTDDANRLNLGGQNGLRGYDTEFASGDRLHVVNIEGRVFPGIEILSVAIGGAVFADLGRAWKTGEPVRFRQYSSSVGLGLRISLEKLTRMELIRIDAAFGQDDHWELSVGTGQYF
jgi:hypothetical protein